MLADYRVSAFVGKGCSGNSHEVFIASAPLNRSAFLRHSQFNTQHIVVAVVPASHADEPTQLAFFQHGREIQRCGSGTIAAAHILFNTKIAASTKYNEGITVRTRNETLTLLKRGELIGYRFKNLTFTRETAPSFWQNIVNLPGKHLLNIRRCGDYTIVQLSHRDMVQRARPKQQLLRLLNPRSLILTACDTSHSPYDYVLRYFAPRYASEEDAATGSANSLLLQYWHKLHGKNALRGQQLSKQGGAFYGEASPHFVELFGQVTAKP